MLSSLGSRQRRVVYMEEVGSKKHAVLQEGNQRRYLTSGDDWHLYPDINFEGDKVVLVSGPDDQHLAVSVLDIDSGRETFVTSQSGRNLHPTFSGDGEKVAFSEETEEGLRHIAILDTPGEKSFEPPGQTIPRPRVVPGSDGGYFPSLSEDGSQVLYQRAKDSKREIVSYDFVTGRERVLAEGMAPSLSFDDEHFAYTKKTDGEWNIHIQDLQTGEDRQVTHTPHFDFAPSFDSEGGLFFASNRGGTFDIYHRPVGSLDDPKARAEVIAQGPETLYAPEASR